MKWAAAAVVCVALAGAACSIAPGPEVAATRFCDIPRSYLELEAHDGASVAAAGTSSFADALRSVYDNAPAPAALSNEEPVSPSMLFMSGGSQHGAFGAGFLEGWAADRPGHLPRFAVVTGISTGSIMATHAFLDRADKIARNYRITHETDVLRPFVNADGSKLGTALTVLRRGAVADLAPMRAMLGAAITPDILVDVANEATLAHRKLFVGAVDVDLGKAVIFDMTALAQRYARATAADRGPIRECYLDAILASSSVPVAALPVFIDNRMYIDGGARFGIISDEIGKVVDEKWRKWDSDALPVSVGGAPSGHPAPSGPNVFTIVNGTLEIEPRCGKADPANCSPQHPDSPAGAHASWGVPDLAQRSISILINQVYRFSNDRIAVRAQARGFEPHVERMTGEANDYPAVISLPGSGTSARTCGEWEQEDARLEKPLEFHPRYMHCLVAFGAYRAHVSKWACDDPVDPRTPPAELARWRQFCGS